MARPLCLTIALAGGHPVFAQNDERIIAAPIVVTPTRVEQSAFDLPTAISAIESESIQEATSATNISESLVRVPGTVVQNRQAYAQEQQIIVRGFGARANFGVRGIKLLADGIPASTPDGQGGAGLFDLGSAKRIEVLRGPFSALYGNHSGGVVQIFTEDGPERPTVTPSFAAGSFDSWKAGLKFGGTSGPLNYIANATRYETEGHRDHSAARKDQFNAKLKVDLGERSSVTLLANYLDQPRNQDPLGLTAAQVAQNPKQSIPQAAQFNSGRNLSNTQAGLVYETDVTERDTLRLLAYVGRRSNEGFLPFAGTVFTSAGGVAAIDRDYYGVGARWTREDSLAGRPFAVTFGADFDTATDTRKGYANNNGVIGVLKRDEDNTAQASGGYAQAEWLFAEQWSASAGLRYTHIDFDSKDRFVCRGTGSGAALPVCPGDPANNAVNPDDSGSVSHDAWTPVVGLVYKATPTLNFYANAGKSFETPTLIELAYRVDGEPGLNFGLDPMTARHYEVGAKMLVGASGLFEVAVFRIDTDKEIVTAGNVAGRQTFKNAGKTQRTGVELSGRGELGGGFAAYGAFTYIDATFEDGFCSGVVAATCAANLFVNEGNRLPAVPRYAAFGDLTWSHPGWGLYAGIEMRWHGNVPVNDLNTEDADSYFVSNARIALRQTSGDWRFSQFLRVDNLFSEEYIGAVAVNDGNGRYYYPAPTRNFLLGWSASYVF